MSQESINLPSIKLNRARLSYPSIFNLKVWEEGKAGKYEATFILDKTKHAKEIAEINGQIDSILKTLKLERNKIKVDNICLKDGDNSNSEEYQNAFTIKATSTKRFHIVNKDGITPVVEDDNVFYGGCYVSCYIDLWTYSKPSNGIACNLRAIQFVADGEPFGLPMFDITDKFDSVEDEIPIF